MITKITKSCALRELCGLSFMTRTQQLGLVILLVVFVVYVLVRVW